MHVVIFQPATWTGFAPLSFTRPVFALVSGATTLLQRQLRRLRPTRVSLWVRPSMVEFCRQRVVPHLKVPATVNMPLDHEPAFLIDAAATNPTAPAQMSSEPFVERTLHGKVACAWVRSPGLHASDVLSNSQRWQELSELPERHSQQGCADKISDLLHDNERLLHSDFAELANELGVLPAGPFHAIAWENIRVGKAVHIDPNVVLDASAGPIILDSEAKIGASSVIQGPCYIGRRTLVRPLSLIRGGCSFGENCKIGGEISSSIFQGNSSKAHDGFVGHSFVGEWVNLGAGTTTSNLKNTYGPISIRIGNREVPTGRIFMGCLIGDYTKTAIHTRLMSGTYLGAGSMVAISEHCPRFVGSFRFLTDHKEEPYELRKAIEVAQRAYARRNRVWQTLDESILAHAKEAAQECEQENLTEPDQSIIS